jgi:catechol 2,3-dioxygenase-like lactoylglutathione lyase family enzyme
MGTRLAIDHVVLPSFDRAATECFYQEVLGLPLVEVFEGVSPVWNDRAFTLSSFALPGGARLELFTVEGLEKPASDGLPVGLRHVALAVDSFDELEAWKRRLDAAGTWTSDFVPHGLDRRSLYFFDPNGHPFELTHRGSPRA